MENGYEQQNKFHFRIIDSTSTSYTVHRQKKVPYWIEWDENISKNGVLVPISAAKRKWIIGIDILTNMDE